MDRMFTNLRTYAAAAPVAIGAWAIVAAPGVAQGAERIDRLEALVGDVDHLLFAVVFVMIALHHLLRHRGGRGGEPHLWLGLTSLGFGAHALASSVWFLEIPVEPGTASRLTLFGALFTAAVFIEFLWSYVGRPVGRSLRAYQLSHLTLGAAALFLPRTWVGEVSALLWLWLAPLAVLTLVMLVREVRGRAPGSVALFVAGLVLLAAVSAAAADRAAGSPAIPEELTYLGIAVFLLSVSAFLADRSIRERREMDGLQRGLEQRVLQRTVELEEARAEAEGASHAKSDFLAVMSHELRTPLNSVIGFANVLLGKGDRLGDRERLYAERILAAGNHLLTIVDDVLDISKVEAGRLEVSVSSTDVTALVRETVAEVEGSAEARGVPIRLELAGPSVTVETDPVRLKQVLLNLVANALKFTREGEVRIRVRSDGASVSDGASESDGTVRETGSGGAVVEVEDTGIGISPEKLDVIFEAFRQAEESTDRRYQGTGLGLAISRSICGILGCDLEVESEEGHGSTFRVVIPPKVPDGAAGTFAIRERTRGEHRVPARKSISGP